MSQTKIWMALALIGGLFLVIGAQASVSAQMANNASMMGNSTNATSMAGGNWTNATNEGNMSGSISGTGCPPRC